MKTCKEYRKQAKEALDGKIFSNTWLLVIIVSIIAGVIESFLSFTVIGSILIIGPLSVGISFYLLNVVRRNEMKNNLASLITPCKTDLGGTILLGFIKNLFIFLWSLLLIIPGIIKTYSYSMAEFIKADHPEYDWKKCIDESRKIMNGKKTKLFLLDLSFIGWAILGLLCFGIGLLWVTAHIDTARACFYEDIKSENNGEESIM